MGAIDLKFLGYCGIQCKRCDIYVASQEGDREKQQEIADWINRHHHAQCTAVEIRCNGCKGPLDEHWSLACKVRLCAAKREVVTCVDCDEYGSCDTLETFYRGGDYESARKTLERISEVGLEEWISEQG
jgi:hypothetical protein